MVMKLIKKLFGKKRKKILVYDDDPSAIQLMDVHLDNLGYEAVGAESPEAVEKLLRNSPAFDMLMFSVGRKKRDAVILARDLRKRNELRRIPILFANVDFAPSELTMVTDSIANSAALTKPFSVSQLRESLQDLTVTPAQKRAAQTKDASPEP